jgi:sugar phosphate isomerase/epimerase
MRATGERRWPLGVCELAWKGISTEECAERAAAAGFDHIDVVRGDFDPDQMALPVGAVLTPKPGSGWAWPAPPPTADLEREIARLQAIEVPRIEPWAGCLWSSDEAIEELRRQVPNLRLVVDTGHVTQWGGDIFHFLQIADNVQLRQAAVGVGQLPPQEGEVDFEALFARLDALDYRGRLTIEYFDLPQFGWPHDDPFGACIELAEFVDPLLAHS